MTARDSRGGVDALSSVHEITARIVASLDLGETLTLERRLERSLHEPHPFDHGRLVVHVRGRGLVVLTGCGHAGVVNIVRHAQRLVGVDRLHALLGGFHLAGPYFAPVLAPTLAALGELAPDLVVPGHCTGWQAQHALAAAFPDTWVPGSVGTRYTLSAA